MGDKCCREERRRVVQGPRFFEIRPYLIRPPAALIKLLDNPGVVILETKLQIQFV